MRITSYYITDDGVLKTFIGNEEHVSFSDVHDKKTAERLIDEENEVLLKDTILFLEKNGYPIEESSVKGFDWFIPSPDDGGGVDLTTEQLFDLEKEVKENAANS